MDVKYKYDFGISTNQILKLCTCVYWQLVINAIRSTVVSNRTNYTELTKAEQIRNHDCRISSDSTLLSSLILEPNITLAETEFIMHSSFARFETDQKPRMISNVTIWERVQKASWARLICCTHQHYHHQWLPNSQIPGDEADQIGGKE